MPRIDIIAAGRLKPGPLLALWQEYTERLTWPLTLHEIEGRNAADEHKKLEAKILASAFVCVLDETGQSLSSRALAEKLDVAAGQGRTHQQFIIGGADGLSPEIRNRADLLLSFGKQTWPHMLARVMLIEQIYRAEKILAGHPYHRD